MKPYKIYLIGAFWDRSKYDQYTAAFDQAEQQIRLRFPDAVVLRPLSKYFPAPMMSKRTVWAQILMEFVQCHAYVVLPNSEEDSISSELIMYAILGTKEINCINPAIDHPFDFGFVSHPFSIYFPPEIDTIEWCHKGDYDRFVANNRDKVIRRAFDLRKLLSDAQKTDFVKKGLKKYGQ